MFRVCRSGRAGALPEDDLEGVPDRDGFGQFPGPNAFETAEPVQIYESGRQALVADRGQFADDDDVFVPSAGCAAKRARQHP